MALAPQAVFAYETEKTEDPDLGPITSVICHGKIISETAAQLKEVVKPLIPLGGQIRLDLTDVTFVDSSGLGTLVGLKISAVKEGYCRLHLVNLSQRLKELLSLSGLSQFIAS